MMRLDKNKNYEVRLDDRRREENAREEMRQSRLEEMKE